MAKLAGSKKITLEEMSQEIDLKKYFKREPTASEKDAFLDIAIEQINERTLDGETIHGGKFKKYSQDYADSKGVTVDSVDLFLEGDMLDSLEGSVTSKNKVKIQINDDLEVKKGFNHHTGDTLPKRPWFGITTSEAKEIAQFIDKASKKKPKKKKTSLNEIEEALKLLGISQVE